MNAPSPGLMCPIWAWRGPVDNRGNCWTRIGEIPQIAMGSEPTPPSPAVDVRAKKLGLDEAPADGVADQTRRLVDVEPRHDPGPVILSRLDAHPQEPSDLLRRLSLRHELQDLMLSGTQRIGWKLSLRQVRLDHSPRDARAQVDPAAAHLLDRLNQVSRRLRLQDIAPDSRSQGVDHVGILGVHGQEDRPRPRRNADD